MDRKSLNFVDRAAIKLMATVLESQADADTGRWPDPEAIADRAYRYAEALEQARARRVGAESAASDATRALKDARAFISGIAYETASGNSAPDVMAAALDNAVGRARGWMRRYDPRG